MILPKGDTASLKGQGCLNKLYIYSGNYFDVTSRIVKDLKAYQSWWRSATSTSTTISPMPFG